jgi:hypothetical protein
VFLRRSSAPLFVDTSPIVIFAVRFCLLFCSCSEEGKLLSYLVKLEVPIVQTEES